MIAIWRDELENAIVNHCPVFGHYVSDNPRDLVPQSFMEVISFPDKIAVDYKGQLKAADTIDDIIELLEGDGIRIETKEKSEPVGDPSMFDDDGIMMASDLAEKMTREEFIEAAARAYDAAKGRKVGKIKLINKEEMTYLPGGEYKIVRAEDGSMKLIWKQEGEDRE